MTWNHYRDAPEVVTARYETEELKTWMRAAALKLRMLYSACNEENTRAGIHNIAQELDRAAGGGS